MPKLSCVSEASQELVKINGVRMRLLEIEWTRGIHEDVHGHLLLVSKDPPQSELDEPVDIYCESGGSKFQLEDARMFEHQVFEQVNEPVHHLHRYSGIPREIA